MKLHLSVPTCIQSPQPALSASAQPVWHFLGIGLDSGQHAHPVTYDPLDAQCPAVATRLAASAKLHVVSPIFYGIGCDLNRTTTHAAEAKTVAISSGKVANKESFNMSYHSTPGSEKQRLAKSLRDAIFTKDFRQGRRIVVVLLTAVVYAVCAALLVYGVRTGLFDPQAHTLAGILLFTAAIYVAVIRSGFNLRFKHPSLALPQALTAQTIVVLSYAVLGSAHPAALPFLAMVLVFGMFEMNGKRVWLLLSYTLAIMSGMMAWCVATRPSVYTRDIELIYFVAMITVLPAISTLSVQLSSMRNRLRKQRVDLEEALQQIRKVATHDELTGLPNRRQMLALLGEHVARFDRGGPSFSIALADLDHFKSVNDTFGHRVGDDALQCFSQQARLHLRSTDIAARWGGEEFLLLLPASPSGDPNIGIERLRGALAVAQASPLAPNLRIAFSTGLARYVSGESIDELIERADKALYLAKNGGRNQTRMALVDQDARHSGPDN